MTSVGLVMIVKNEARVVRRSMTSALPLIDYALICDTGSTDGTQQVVRDWLAEHHIPGQVLEHPWRDFAHNRNLSLQALRAVPEVDYALVIDADEYFVFDDGFDAAAFKASLPRADVYNVVTHHGDYRYVRRQLFANRMPFRYKDVVHAYLVSPPAAREARAIGFYNQYTYEGARAVDPRKFHKNAEILERELLTATAPFDVARYTFFLAQSYRDAGVFDKAYEAFMRRTTMGFWQEEVAQSFYYAAAALERLGAAPKQIIETYLKGHAVTPLRVEFLCQAARVCRTSGDYEQGYELAQRGLDRPMLDGLFVDVSVYNWRMLDEYQMLAFWTGNYAESVIAADRLLSEGKLPAEELGRVELNAAMALERYSETASA